MRAAPALFASPGDLFTWQSSSPPSAWAEFDYGEVYVKYVGRNEVASDGTSPEKGWLIFHDHNCGRYSLINVCNGGIRDALGAWPMKKYSHYTEDGTMIPETLCIPPEMCGALNLPVKIDDDDKVIPPPDVHERMKDVVITKTMIQEAKRAVPALVAKKGDFFEWKGWYENVVVRYAGRNELPPLKLKKWDDKYSTPEIGWLIFHNPTGYWYNEWGKDGNAIDTCNSGIRDGLGAWPWDAYSHYNCDDLKEATTLFELALWKFKIDSSDESVDRADCRVEVPGPVKDTLFQYLEVNRIPGTLCIPPAKCGLFNVWKRDY